MSVIGNANTGSVDNHSEVVIPAIVGAVFRLTPGLGCSCKAQFTSFSNAVNHPSATRANWYDWPYGATSSSESIVIDASITAIRIIQLTGTNPSYYDQAFGQTEASGQFQSFAVAPPAANWPVNLPIMIAGSLYLSDGTTYNPIGGGGGGGLTAQVNGNTSLGTATNINIVDKAQVETLTGGTLTLPRLTSRALLRPQQSLGFDEGKVSPLTIPLAGNMNGALYPLRTPGQTICWFDTAANARVINTTGGDVGSLTISNDTTDPIIGTNAVKASITASGGGAGMLLPAIGNTNTAGVDVSNRNIEIAVKVTGTTSPTALSLRIYDATTAVGSIVDTTTPYHVCTAFIQGGQGQSSASGHYLPIGIWTVLSLPIEKFTAVGGGANLSAIVAASMKITNAGVAGVATSIEIGTITARKKALTRGCVVLGFDDCKQEAFQVFLPVMAKYGFPGVLYPGAPGNDLETGLIPSSSHLTANDWHLLQDIHGWQVGSQAYMTEAPTGYSNDQFQQELQSIHMFYRGLGVYGSADGSYFSGISAGGTYDKEFRKAFRTMRMYTNFVDANDPLCECAPFADPMYVRAYGLNDNQTITGIQKYIQQAIDTKGIAVLVWHGADATINTAFAAMCAFLDTHRDVVEVCTMDGVIQRMAGQANYGQLNVSHIRGVSPAPAITADVGAGTSPTIAMTGNDIASTITLTTGATPTGLNAVIATITFSSKFVGVPKPTLQPANANAAALSGVTAVYIVGATTTTATLISGATGLTAATQYVWNVINAE